MSRIIGSLEIDFHTKGNLKESELEKFNEKFNTFITEIECFMHEAAKHTGFEITSENPITEGCEMFITEDLDAEDELV